MKRPSRAWRTAPALVPALLLLAAVVFAAIFGDYGITWDEGVQSTYGELVLDYFGSSGGDQRALDYSNLFYYGPLFETVAAATYRAAGYWKYEIRHALIGLTAWLTLVAVWRYARRFGPGPVSLFAVLALATMPRFLGHAFNNSKDVPFACAFAWAMVGILRLAERERWGWRDALLCGGGIGLALGVRVGAMLLFGMLAIALLGSVLLDSGQRGAWRAAPVGRAVKVLAAVAVAWTVMVGTWPWAQAEPWTRPFTALAEMSSFTFSYTVLYAGELVRSDQLPRTYLPAYLTITTPLAVLLLAVWGGWSGFRGLLGRPRPPSSLAGGLLLAWLFVPLTYVLIRDPNVYDGIRHFLFLLPALAMLAGLGAARLVERFAGPTRYAAIAAVTLLLLLPLRPLVVLHPYQSSYFNLLVGGATGAWGRYDMDYWASSYREAIDWVLDDIARTDVEQAAIAVACSEVNRPCAEYYLTRAKKPAPQIDLYCVWDGTERLPPDISHYVGTLRYGKAATFFPRWPVVHSVGRQGAVFSVVKRAPPQAGIANPTR